MFTKCTYISERVRCLGQPASKKQNHLFCSTFFVLLCGSLSIPLRHSFAPYSRLIRKFSFHWVPRFSFFVLEISWQNCKYVFNIYLCCVVNIEHYEFPFSVPTNAITISQWQERHRSRTLQIYDHCNRWVEMCNGNTIHTCTVRKIHRHMHMQRQYLKWHKNARTNKQRLITNI